jgi:hypothetical protein
MQCEPSIDINPLNPENVVAAWIDYRIDGSAKLAFGYSFDGGVTWNDGIFPSLIGGFPYQGDPSVASDREGNFYISFISFNPSGGYTGGIFVAKSTDGGVTWPSIIRLDDDDVFDDKPYIAIDKTTGQNSGNIYVVWNDVWPTNHILCSRSTDQGNSFQKQIINDVPRWEQLGAMPAVDANGTLYVVWIGEEINHHQTYYKNLYFDKSTDGGLSFGNETIITTVGYFTGLGINLMHRVYPFPIIATNPMYAGHIYLTWSNHIFGPDPMLYSDSSDVLFMHSTDGGLNWSSPVNIVNNQPDPSPTPNDQFMPWIAINPTGDRVSIMYYDRSDFANNDSMYVKIVTTIDDGITWLPPFTISDVALYPAIPPFYDLFMGDYNGMVYSTNGELFPVWADSRNGNWDIYTAPANMIVSSNNIVSGWQTLSIPVYITNYNKSVVWSNSNSDAFSYGCGGSYVAQDVLDNGSGYYIKYNSTQTQSYIGAPITQLGTPICAGWNIIGSISEQIPVATNLCLFPATNTFTSPFYTYENGYIKADNLVLGIGYWIKVSQDGSILLNNEPIQCDSPESFAIDNLDHFTISDEQG